MKCLKEVNEEKRNILRIRNSFILKNCTNFMIVPFLKQFPKAVVWSNFLPKSLKIVCIILNHKQQPQTDTLQTNKLKIQALKNTLSKASYSLVSHDEALFIHCLLQTLHLSQRDSLYSSINQMANFVCI